MSKSKINVANFQILMQAIMDNYKSFNIYQWGSVDKQSPCGTVGCIAGTADWLANNSGMEPAKGCQFLFNKDGSINKNINNKDYYNDNDETWSTKNAIKWLGITKNEAELLFFPSQWPDFFSDALEDTLSLTDQHARLTVSRIQYFLATGK